MEVAPSILSADFARLGEQVRMVLDAGARVIHCDVMDGHFVPPITFGPIVVSALRDALPDDVHLDVHLMIDRPERQVGEFAKAGADTITFHAEATPHIDYTVNAIREAGARAGLAVCPGTPADVFEVVEPDLYLVMTVNPGWGGQPFIASQLDKIRRVRDLAGDRDVEVDGGVNPSTGSECAAAGANWFVAGSAVFNAADPVQAFREIVSSVQSSAAAPQ